MKYFVPFLLTFLSCSCYGYLLSTFSFVHKHLIQLFLMSGTQYGLVNALSAVGATFGVLIFLIFTAKIKHNIVTFYTWICIAEIIPYLVIVGSSILWLHPNKIILYSTTFFIGFTRCMEIPSLLIMIKIHKEISSKTRFVQENDFKLITLFWSVGLDFGAILGFFLSNWLQYTVGIIWQQHFIIGSILKIITTILVLFSLRAYLYDQHEDAHFDKQHPNLDKFQAQTQTFFNLLLKSLQAKLFLINSTILGSIHLGFFFLLPPLFYASGYRGNQGNLVALFCLFIVIGTCSFGILNYVLSKKSMQNLQNNTFQIMQSDKKMVKQAQQKNILSRLSSISLLLFVITLLLMTFGSTVISKQSKRMSIMLMCCLGLFFGGPLKSYFSHRAIKVMTDFQEYCLEEITSEENAKKNVKQSKESQLHKYYQNNNKLLGGQKNHQNDQLQKSQKNWPNYQNYQKGKQEKQETQEKVTDFQQQNSSLSKFEDQSQHLLQIGASLISLSRVTTHIGLVILFVISFYLIQKYQFTVLLGLFTLLAILGLIFDIYQSYATNNAVYNNKNGYDKISDDKQQLKNDKYKRNPIQNYVKE